MEGIQMPTSKARRRSGHGEVLPPLSKLEKIRDLLKIQVETFPQKDLTPAEVERWGQDLGGYAIEAIEYAFDTHRRLAMFFPVPADILELCKTWAPAQESTHLCSDECRERHGRGYGWTDGMKLWKLFNAKFEQLQRKLTKAEWEELYVEVDKQRGQVPAWRA
jgi:hypothetical protein